MTLKNIDFDIKNLFYKLIAETPAAIKHKALGYNINGEVIEVWWTVKTKTHVEASSCHDYYDKTPFDGQPKYRGVGLFFPIWDTNSGERLDGYTFYINTPMCQFKVPELSRSELVKAMDLIEYHYEKFIPNYLNKLLDIPTCDYGELLARDGRDKWEPK